MQTDPRFNFKTEDALLAYYRALEATHQQAHPASSSR